MAEAVAVSAAVAASTEVVSMVVGSMGAASAVAVSTAVVVSMGDISAVALSTAVAFVVAVSVVAVSTVAAFAVTVLVITDSLMMSSSAASAFLDGGAGGIRTDITVMTITRMITMDTAIIRMVTMDSAVTRTTTMDMADTGTTTAPVTDTSMAADQGIPGVSGGGDKPRLRLSEIAGLLMRVDQVGPSDASIRRQDHRED